MGKGDKKISYNVSKLYTLGPVITLLASIGALTFAIFVEISLQLEPCKLCLYQRIPHMTAIVIGLIGCSCTSIVIKHVSIGLSGLIFLISSIIALHHIGVEQEWWNSIAMCGGALTNFTGTSSFLEALSQQQGPTCTNPEWTFFGLSMATYNFLYSLSLALFFIWVLIKLHLKGRFR